MSPEWRWTIGKYAACLGAAMVLAPFWALVCAWALVNPYTTIAAFLGGMTFGAVAWFVASVWAAR